MRLVIYDIPKSVNKRRGEHWGAAKRYKDYWVKMVRTAIDNSHKPCKTRMRVSISMMRKRKLDPDNLVASCKPLIDSLVYWKLIKDDSEKWIELDCRQVVGKEKITIVVIEEVV
jgi:hypothetical protein